MKWADPPPSGLNRGAVKFKYSDDAEELRTNPGKWAILKEGVKPQSAAAFASNVRSGKLRAFETEAGKYEAAVRLGTVYVRFVPEED